MLTLPFRSGFEEEAEGWTFNPSALAKRRDDHGAHSGSWAAWLSGTWFNVGFPPAPQFNPARATTDPIASVAGRREPLSFWANFDLVTPGRQALRIIVDPGTGVFVQLAEIGATPHPGWNWFALPPVLCFG